MNSVMPSLLEILAEIPDPRQAQGRRYPLAGMLTVVCGALLCGYETIHAIAEWGANYGESYREQLGFGRHGYPSRMTWYRVLGQVDMGVVEAKLSAWAEQAMAETLTPDELVVISVDGKTLRGSKKQGAEDSHLLAALASPSGVVLGQVAVSDKTNEIGAVTDLLDRVNLAGRLVTADALLTQHKVVDQILAAGGDYLLPVKGNQELTFYALRTWFAKAPPPGFANHSAELVEKSHGRLIIRRINVTVHLNEYLDWQGMHQAFQLVRTTTHLASGKHTFELAYGITSSQADPATLLAFTRQHWAIENRLHYVRDVTFHEDLSTLRVGRTHHCLATFRNLVLSLLRLAQWQNIAQALRFYAAQPNHAFTLLASPLRM